MFRNNNQNQQSEAPNNSGMIDTSANGAAAMMQDDSMPTNVEDDQNYQFYKEYCRLYYANIILTNRLQQLLNEKKDLQFKLSRLEVRREQRQGLASSLPAVWSTHHIYLDSLWVSSLSWLTLSLCGIVVK